MRALVINKTPRKWLTDVGESPGKINEVMSTFKAGATVWVCMYGAEHLFIRFHGKKAKRSIFEPNYWVDGSAIRLAFARASQFEGWLTDAEIAKVAKNHYREIAAICHNWNDLGDVELWKIELRRNERIEGIEGPAAPQPSFAATPTQTASSSLLSGGATQVYLHPRTPFICTPVDWSSFG